MLTNIKIKNIFAFIRITCYLALFITFIIIPTEYFINKPAGCVIRDNFGVFCPCCGVTRCFSSLLHFKFSQAIYYNVVFAIGIYPICLIIFIEDTIKTLIRVISKKETYSLLERFIYNV